MTSEIRFRSKIDLLMVFFVIGITIIIGSALLSFTSYLSHPQSFWWAAAGGLLLYSLVWWSTSYVLNTFEVHIRCCGVEWRIPIGDIRKVTSGLGFSYGAALSVERLEISYGSMKSVTISPRDTAAFLSALGDRRATA